MYVMFPLYMDERRAWARLHLSWVQEPSAYSLTVESRALYSTDQGYAEGSWAEAKLFNGAFVQAFGKGEGTVTWEGKSGRIEWSNFPTRRPDGVFLPDMSGVIHLDDHQRPVLYRMRGVSLAPDEDGRRLFGGPVQWFTDEPSLHWLNDWWGYEEGEIDVNTLRFRTVAYVLEPDPPF